VPAEDAPHAATANSRAEIYSGMRADAAAASSLLWRSARCSANSCVEVAEFGDGRVAIRDSKAGHSGPILVFGRDEWRGFIAAVKADEFG
jgi:uncharacterized protein DUF397